LDPRPGLEGTGPGNGFRPVRPDRLRLRLRFQTMPWRGVAAWREVEVVEDIPAAQTAILICDVWDRHWCAAAERRLAAMIPRMQAVVSTARSHGVQIIHAPSEVVAAYAQSPQRLRMLSLPVVAPPPPQPLPDPPLPIDDSDGGCDSHDPLPRDAEVPWTRQHPGISIEGHDVISDQGVEVWNLLRHLGIPNLIFMGVHTNMCILHRSFGIKAMTRWGIRCILVRDLTDAMYNPDRWPGVSHEQGTELVIQHIEQHWCPTVLSQDLLQALTP
jgi:nicotinamidase-related amidase